MLPNRWPWPIFRLMQRPLRASLNERRDVACRLLGEEDSSLEDLSRNIRSKCLGELNFISTTGKFPLGSQLHAILASMAINMRLDSGSLESLNSMVKSAMSLASNTRMSLELLSSRVNSRKTCTLLSGGSTKLKDVRPVLESLAKSLMLHQGSETNVLADTYRWTPPLPVKDMTPNTPKIYDPSLTLSSSQKWAVQYHRKLMKCLRQSTKHAADSKDIKAVSVVQAICFTPQGFSICVDGVQYQTAVFLVAEITARTCQLVHVMYHTSSSTGSPSLQLRTRDLVFRSSIDIIAGLQSSLQTVRKSKVCISLFYLGLADTWYDSGSIILTIRGEEQHLFDIHSRKPREIKQTIDAPAPLADGDIDGVELDVDAEPEMIQREVEFQEALLPSSSQIKV